MAVAGVSIGFYIIFYLDDRGKLFDCNWHENVC